MVVAAGDGNMTSITRFAGLMSNADPIDVAQERGAVVQHNCHPRRAGDLSCRRGLTPISFSGAGGIVMHGIQVAGVSGGVWQAGTSVYVATNATAGVEVVFPAIETDVDGTQRSCFMQTRKGDIVRINGVSRGSIWQGDVLLNSAVNLGITAPASDKAPVVTAHDSGGDQISVAEPASGDIYVTYYCAYRYLDDKGGDDAEKGVPSSISPITEVKVVIDPEEDFPAITFRWSGMSLNGESRVSNVQLWRSTTDQADVLYLVNTQAGITAYNTDTDTDAELLTAAADTSTILPILFADGSLGARRFEPPPEFMTVCVAFKNRYIYTAPYGDPEVDGVAGAAQRALYISHPDEPESVPPSQNVFYLQPDSNDNDTIRAAIPWSQVLWIFMDRHTHVFSYASDPRYDGSSRSVYPRGALNQRCVASMGDTLYVLDMLGCWKMTQQGYTAIDEPIADLFREQVIDFSRADAFFVSVEQNEQVVRFHVLYTTDPGPSAWPTRTLAYHIPSGGWSTEEYGTGLGASMIVVADDVVSTLVSGRDNRVHLLAQGLTDNGEPIEWSYKTGLLTIPPGDDGQPRNVWLAYQPVDGVSETVAIQLFYDRNTTAEEFGRAHQEGRVTNEAGANEIIVDIETGPPSGSRLGPGPGMVRFPLHYRADRRVRTHRYLSIGLSGTQNNVEHVIQGLEIEGTV